MEVEDNAELKDKTESDILSYLKENRIGQKNIY